MNTKQFLELPYNLQYIHMNELSKHAMYYGIFLSGFFLLNFILSTISSWVVIILQLLVISAEIYFVYRTTLSARDSLNDGSMTYFISFIYIVKLFMYASILVAFYKYIYFKFLNPEFLSVQYDITEKLLVDILSDSDIQNMKNTLTNASFFSINTIWYNMFGGTIVGLIVSAFVKKKNANIS